MSDDVQLDYATPAPRRKSSGCFLAVGLAAGILFLLVLMYLLTARAAMVPTPVPAPPPPTASPGGGG